MKFSSDEKTLITVLAITAPGGQPVGLSALEEFFDRRCKLRKAVKSLERSGIITHDPFASLVRLLVRPALRALSCGPSAAQGALFEQERPLDAALARTQRLAGKSSAPNLCSLAAPCVPKHAPCVPEHAFCVPEHAPPPHLYNVVTSNRSNVTTIKRNVDVDALRSAVEKFVGKADFERYWTLENFWNDPGRCRILNSTLNYIRAGLKHMEIRTRKTPGAHLWNQFQHDCRAKGIEARK
jgi:hypothetical protein